MPAPLDGAHVGFNLGPWVGGDGAYVAFNLGVRWSDEPEIPPEPVVRGLVAGVGLHWRRGMASVAIDIELAWARSPRVRSAVAVPWAISGRLHRPVDLPWGTTPRIGRAVDMAWRGSMRGVSDSLALAWRQLPHASTGVALPWMARMARASLGVGLPFHASLPVAVWALHLAWLSGLAGVHAGTTLAWRQGAIFWEAMRLPWRQGRPIRWAWIPPKPLPPPPPPPLERDGAHVGFNLACRWRDFGGIIPFNLGVPCYGAREVSASYVMTDTVTCVRLPDRTPIHVAAFGISGGRDAWGWSLDLALADPDQLALLKPTAAGPRQVELSLNGKLWTFIIESHGQRRDFERGMDITVAGRSRTALLAEPYAPARSKVSMLPRTAAQLVDEELQDTGVIADYETVDWVVPGETWSYQGKSPLDAISDIATASGAVVQSDPAEMIVRVRPRYPVSPWLWTDTAPDVVINADMILDDSLTVRSVPMYDAVVVTGELEGKSVAVRVVREGGAGNLYAPQASHVLGNTEAVCTERGRNIMSDRGEQAAITHTVPIMADPVPAGGVGRVMPLDLCEVREPSGYWQGIATDVRIEGRVESSGEAPVWVVDQIVTIERHYSDAN